MRPRVTRRRFLGASAATVAAVTGGGWLAGRGLLGPGEPGRLLPSEVPPPRPYQVPLPVPPVLAPVRTDATTDHYEIVQRPAALSILPGLTTEAWTYHGSFPGPTIRSRAGRRTVVRHRNTLPHPTVVHLHGGHTPADSDGYPADLIMPAGGTTAAPAGHDGHGHHHGGHPPGRVSVGERDYTYPMRQRAATLWYHDHRHGHTGVAVWRGLAGFHLVHDEEEDALRLPTGDRDLPIMIADRSFAADGSLRYPLVDPNLRTPGVTEPYMNGVLGDVILVNGAPWPVLATDRARYRLRLLSASNARRYRLALDPPPPGGGGVVQIGGDGGLLRHPVRHDELDISPAERFDVLVDFSRYRPGTRVRLVNRLGRPLARPRLGTTEVWRLISDFHHPVHVHLDPFQVISRNNRAPGPYDAGWKDTVDVRPSEAVEIAVRFTDHAGAFMLHCHNLEHEDMAMMADFVTT
ncbi:multicopper oxidase family protein [Micromonospora sp. NPDC004336]